MTGVIVGVFVGRLALAKISIVVLALDSGRSRSSRQPCSRPERAALASLRRSTTPPLKPLVKLFIRTG